MLKKRHLLLYLVTMLVLSVVFTGPAMGSKKFFAIATGGTGGTYYPLGGALAQALSTKIPDLIVTAQSGNASTANLNLIRTHGIESAFVQNNAAFHAYTGIEQFKGNPVKNVRGIASLYPEVIQIVTLKSANIKSLKDLKGKSVVPGDRGSVNAVDAENLMKSVDMSFKDFGTLDFLGFTSISQRMKDGHVDVGFIVAGIPTASVMELASQTDISILNLDDKLIKKICDTWPFYAKTTIPAGTYKGQDKPVNTVAVLAQWVVDAGIDDDLVYKLTTALWEKGTHVLRKKGDKAAEAPSAAAIMAQVHAKGKDVTPGTALDGMAIPLHPGAARYYKEKGLIKK